MVNLPLEVPELTRPATVGQFLSVGNSVFNLVMKLLLAPSYVIDTISWRGHHYEVVQLFVAYDDATEHSRTQL